MLKLSAAGWLQMYTSSTSSIEHFDNKTKTKPSIGSQQLKLITNPATFSAGGLSFCSPTAAGAGATHRDMTLEGSLTNEKTQKPPKN
jgi:hypothetical protein